MKVSGIQCPNCKDIVYSRAGHDWRQCSCQECYVDGGQGQFRRVGYTTAVPASVQLEVIGVDQRDLYNDWNRLHGGTLGLLKGGATDDQHKILAIDGVTVDDAQT